MVIAQEYRGAIDASPRRRQGRGRSSKPSARCARRAHLEMTATAAGGFFERRLSVITRAFGSPKMPRTVGCGRKPGKQYASHSRLRRKDRRAIQIAWQIPSPVETHSPYAIHSFLGPSASTSTHPNPRRPEISGIGRRRLLTMQLRRRFSSETSNNPRPRRPGCLQPKASCQKSGLSACGTAVSFPT
jgi:hypothetical protein